MSRSQNRYHIAINKHRASNLREVEVLPADLRQKSLEPLESIMRKT